eukprot:593514-Pyramimonas_sp.AAC.1
MAARASPAQGVCEAGSTTGTRSADLVRGPRAAAAAAQAPAPAGQRRRRRRRASSQEEEGRPRQVLQGSEVQAPLAIGSRLQAGAGRRQRVRPRRGGRGEGRHRRR